MDENKPLINYPDTEESASNRKFRKLVEYLSGLKQEKFTGYIKINYTQGQIGRTEKFEEILRQK